MNNCQHGTGLFGLFYVVTEEWSAPPLLWPATRLSASASREISYNSVVSTAPTTHTRPKKRVQRGRNHLFSDGRVVKFHLDPGNRDYIIRG